MYIKNLSSIVNSYDLFIIDIYGVIFDGTKLIPEAFAAIEYLNKSKRNFFLLSNSPRPQYVTRQKIVQSLNTMGVTNSCIDEVRIFTSGDMFAEFMVANISQNTHKFPYIMQQSQTTIDIWGSFELKNDFSFLNGKVFLLGANSNHHLIKEINQKLSEKHLPNLSITTRISEANYVIILGASDANEPGVADKFNQELDLIVKAKLPVLCPNPDISAPGGSESRVFTPGFYAQKYRMMGGSEVYYFGKPFQAVYDFAIEKYCLVQNLNPLKLKNSKILCIGDSIVHDICGAYNIGADALLIDNGYSIQIDELPQLLNYHPNYRMKVLKP